MAFPVFAAIIGAVVALYSNTIVNDLTIQHLDQLRQDHRVWLDALIQVESGGDAEAVGDDGKALGVLQIHQVYWQDAVEISSDLATRKYEDVKDPEYAERVVIAYMMRYARNALIASDYEKTSRIHNGGPRGHRKRATLPYWEKVEAIMSKKP